jgi:hypothetical protein
MSASMTASTFLRRFCVKCEHASRHHRSEKNVQDLALETPAVSSSRLCQSPSSVRHRVYQMKIQHTCKPTRTLRSFRSFAVNFGFTFFTAPVCADFKIPLPALPPTVVEVIFAYDTSVVASANVWLSSRSRAERSAASVAARNASCAARASSSECSLSPMGDIEVKFTGCSPARFRASSNDALVGAWIFVRQYTLCKIETQRACGQSVVSPFISITNR